MGAIDDSDTFVAHRYLVARTAFAHVKCKLNAAALLRSALIADGADLINDEELEGVIFDIIDYLEGNHG